MPTKIFFKLFDVNRNLIRTWRPNGAAAGKLIKELLNRWGDSAAHMQWCDDLSGKVSRLYPIDDAGVCRDDIEKYRRDTNPMTNGSARTYRRGVLRGSPGFTNTDFIKAGRSHETVPVYEAPEPEPEMSDEEYERLVAAREQAIGTNSPDVTTAGNNDDSVYTQEELDRWEAEMAPGPEDEE